jgi:mannan endo-1,4-beta-mannosidase
MMEKRGWLCWVFGWFLLPGLLVAQWAPDVDSVRKYLVDKEVTEKTAIMFYNMMENSKKGIMLGQQDVFLYRQINYPDPDMCDIKHTTGKYPLVNGLDFMFITDVNNTPGSWFEDQERQIKEQAIRGYNKGMVSTFTWHFRNPYTKDWFSVEGKPDRVAIAKKSMASILPGGENHAYYKSVLQKIASVFLSLKDSSDNLIPFFFRPFHEFDGNWFWWGEPYCTPEQFKENWKFTVHYLRDSLHVPNILYAFAPDNRFNSINEYLERYPGNDYVDMVGMDNYYDFESNKVTDAAKKLKIISDYAQANHKLAALTECGYRNQTKPSNLYTAYFLKALKMYPLQLSYLMFWSNGKYTPVPGQNTAPDFIDFTNDTLILLEGDLKDMYIFEELPFEFMEGKVTQANSRKLQVSLSAEPKDTAGFTGFVAMIGKDTVGIDSIIYSKADRLMLIYIDSVVSWNHEITLSYEDGNVADAKGQGLIGFAGAWIDNLLTGAPPRLKSATTDDQGSKIVLYFNKKMKLDGFGSDSLSVTELNSQRKLLFDSVNFHHGDSSTVALMPAENLFLEYNLLLKYNDTLMYSSDSGRMAKITGIPVQNNSPGLPPSVVKGWVQEDGMGLTLQFNKPLKPTPSIMGNFSLKVNGEVRTVSSILMVGDRIGLGINNRLFHGDSVVLSFNGAEIVSADRGTLSEIVGNTITNDLEPVYLPRHIGNIVISVASSGYKVDTAHANSLLYLDRTYLLGNLPDWLKGAEYIIWQNDLKDDYAGTLLSFRVLDSGMVYIAHDDRLNKPTWLSSGFTRTDSSLTLVDTEATLFKKYYNKNNLVSLGANQIQGTETGTSTNYVVFFVPGKNPVLPVGIPDGLQDLTNRRPMLVFPNPCHRELHVNSGDFVFNKVEIIDLLGKVVFQEQTGSNTQKKIAFDLPAGYYCLKVSNAKSFRYSYIYIAQSN